LSIHSFTSAHPYRFVRTTTFLCVIAFARALLCAEIEIKDAAGVALLRSVSQQHKGNLERIRTWRGAIQIATKSIIKQSQDGNTQPLTIDSEANVSFVCDRPRKKLRANYASLKHTISGIDEASLKENQALSKAPHCNFMVANDAYYCYEFDSGLDSIVQDKDRSLSVGRVAIVRAAGERRKPSALGMEIDPFYWFTYNGKDVATVFNNYHDWAKDGSDVSHVTLSRDGNLVTLLLSRGDMFNKYVVDCAQGANLAEYHASDGPSGTQETWTYKYEEVGGAWVPQHVSLSIDSAGGSHNSRTLQWTENRINEQVDEAEFTLLKLGLRRGDRVEDKRSGERFRIQGIEFPASSSDVEIAGERGISLRMLLLVGNVIVVLGLLTTVLLRRRRKRHA
jgi:hypothetical protein